MICDIIFCYPIIIGVPSNAWGHILVNTRFLICFYLLVLSHVSKLCTVFDPVKQK